NTNLSAGNQGPSSNNAEKKLASSKTPIPAGRSVSADKPIPAGRSVFADKSIPAVSVAQALLDPDWVEAMQEELQQFQNQRVWVLVELPEGKHAIGTKWILKNKRDARGIVCRNKA
nr:putative ribonuclease H-like domain-containing protein [Tanacetum cinerariifolium]